jgi:predicted pyridoxine 5'-phosphate oxidase superfamily flavin-nucleotide-binding protein
MAQPETLPGPSTRLPDPRLVEALAFDAPYVVDKLVKDRIADTLAEAGQLFSEAKRFIVLCTVTADVACEMFSVRVDEAWHQFILYTAEYTDFCRRYFGRYVSHRPNNAPAGGRSREHPVTTGSMSFADFRRRYEEFFGEPLPDVWYDIRSVTPARRVIADSAREWTLTRRNGLVDLRDGSGHVVLSVDDLAAEALDFARRTGAFYVRELPGGLTDDEKTVLVEALMISGLVRCAG